MPSIASGSRLRRAAPAALAIALLVASVAPAAARPDTHAWPPAAAAAPASASVVVYGGTPAGVVAAIAAARAGASVILIEPSDRLGGMMSSGLSWTDRGDIGVIGGLAREVFDRIQAAEGSAHGRYAFAPSTAAVVFEAMAAEAGVTVVLGQRLAESADAVATWGGQILEIRMESGRVYAADVFIDADYSGDLMARAGVDYRVGREANDEFGESLAGVRPARVAMRVPPGMDLGFPLDPPGDVGSADDRIQSSNYRVCLSTDPGNRVPFSAPPGYDPERFAAVAAYIDRQAEAGGTPTKSWVLHLDPLVDGKWDLNQNGAVTLGLPGANGGHPEGTYATRAAIEAEHRAYQQGLLYFLAGDPSVPAEIRNDVAGFGLCADEFIETGNWPPLLYVREGRRMVGARVLTQHDATMLVSKPDTIGLASYPIDSHVVSRWIDTGGRLLVEGSMGAPRQRHWSISYAALTPKRTQARNLLVPVAASATHVAYASVRVEPQFMIMGQAAGVAAALAAERGIPVQDVPIAELQARLRSAGAVLDDPGDSGGAFYPAIEWAYREGITAGCAAGRFCPATPIRRDELAGLLARGLDLPAAPTDAFADDAGNLHEAAINSLAAAGLVSGCGSGRYCPERLVSRAEMASLATRAFDLSAGDDGGTGWVTRGELLALLHRAHRQEAVGPAWNRNGSPRSPRPG